MHLGVLAGLAPPAGATLVGGGLLRQARDIDASDAEVVAACPVTLS